MHYPSTLSEHDTIAAARKGVSIARFGDGEFNLVMGRPSVSQRFDVRLQYELVDILNYDTPGLLACIPPMTSATPRREFWSRFNAPGVRVHLHATQYGSSFVSRPDNAPWIDTPDYWENVRDLWRGKDVIYVGGSAKLANVMYKSGVANIQIVACPLTNAYDGIDRIEEECASRNRGCPVIISLGAAGTALAARLAKRGIYALDLGHIGTFMTPENQGAFAFTEDQLTTPEYRALIRHAHETTNWGRGGASWAEPIVAFAKELGTTDVLDYGAGGRTLAPVLAAAGLKPKEYDPGVPEISIDPKIADLVVSTDVFEHIEPALIPNVLRHAYLKARVAGYFVIAKQPAKKVLADGRNAHVSLYTTEQWIEFLRAAGWTKIKVVKDEWKKVVLKCRKD